MKQPNATDAEAVSGADLVLLVEERRSDGQLQLVFRCAGPRPELVVSYESFAPVSLAKDGAVELETYLEQVENLKLESSADREVAETRLLGAGLTLGRQLLPKDLQIRLASLWGRAKTVQVVSDEAWIPWELLAVEGPQEEARFLAEAFTLCRWFSGLREVVGLPLERLAVVSPRDSGLRQARQECASLVASGRHRAESVVARPKELLKALESGRFDGWHFSGHGFARGASPEQWKLELEDRQGLLPSDLKAIGRGFGRNRPFVFLNACRSARGGRKLVGAGGLAAAFLQAGAGAVVGTNWAVHDARAAEFSAQLYAELAAGRSLPEAVRRTRLWLRECHPGDPTWLAYAVYAYPWVRVGVPTLASSAASESAPPMPLTAVNEPSPAGGERSRFERRRARRPVSRFFGRDGAFGRAARRGTAAALLVLLMVALWWVLGTPGLPVELWSSYEEPNVIAKQRATLGGGEDDRAPDRKSEPGGPLETIESRDGHLPSPGREDSSEGLRETILDSVEETTESPLEKPAEPSAEEGSGPASPDTQTRTLVPAGPPPPLPPFRERLKVVEGQPARSGPAALSISVRFDQRKTVEFVKLTLAPDGRKHHEETFYDSARPSLPLETQTGRWRLHVLDVSRHGRSVHLDLSEEDP